MNKSTKILLIILIALILFLIVTNIIFMINRKEVIDNQIDNITTKQEDNIPEIPKEPNIEPHYKTIEVIGE